jgi:hypothetical protein
MLFEVRKSVFRDTIMKLNNSNDDRIAAAAAATTTS